MSAPASLNGVRVLDLSRVLAGPWAAQTLGDLGADVIKVERPGLGDDTRLWGPPYLRDEDGLETRESAYFLCANRNKKSITVDFTQADGAALIRDLACASDVLIENFKVGGLQRYGLDYASLHALNPRLVYCSITGFGSSGAYAARPGYDLLIQAMGGLMSVTGRPDGEPGAGPQKAGVALTDVITGLYASVGIMSALTHRAQTGQGQLVEVALLDAQVAALANQAMNFLVTDQAPRRLGNAHPSIVPYQDLPTADGAIIVAVGNDGQFAALCRAISRPEWAEDIRFTTNAARVANRKILIDDLCALTRTRASADWLAVFEQAGVPAGPVNSLAQVFDDPHVQERGLRIDTTHASGTHVPTVKNPLDLSQTPVSYRLAPPHLGEHTDEVLRVMLGLTSSRIAELRAARVI